MDGYSSSILKKIYKRDGLFCTFWHKILAKVGSCGSNKSVHKLWEKKACFPMGDAQFMIYLNHRPDVCSEHLNNDIIL